MAFTPRALLRERWDAAAAGRAGLVLVRGDAGVGKSRLMAELAAAARQSGAVVAGTQCFGTAGRLALAPVADWLRAPPVQAARGGLEPVWRAEVERLVPASRGRPDADPGPRAMVDAWQRHRFFEGLTRALTGLGRPLLLTLDNLHWSDPETLAFLTFCLGLVPDAPLLVVATMRDEPEDQEPGLDPWIVRMRASGTLTEVLLEPLGTAATAALGAAVAGHPLTPDEAATLAAATGGYPLYIVEAARDGGGPAGGPVSAVLARRLAQVPAEAREVAGLAAAVGRDVGLDLLTEASDLDADTVVRAVDELWRRRILHAAGEGYAFSHDLLREAAYAQVSPPRRWLLHRRLAQGLELLHADDPDAVSAQLAEQHARGGQGTRAIAHYRRAAEVAACRLAHGEAIRLHEAALAIVAGLPDGRNKQVLELELLEETAAPLNARFGYASPRLRHALERTVELAERLGRRDSLLGARVGLWTSQFVHGDTGAAHLTAARALDLLDPGSPLAGPVHFAAGGTALHLGRLTEGTATLLRAAEYGGNHEMSIGTRVDVHARAWASHGLWLLGRGDEALTVVADALALARASDNPYCLTVALAYTAMIHQLRDDLPGLHEAVGELRELCDRFEFAYYRNWGLLLDGWARTNGELVRRGIDGLVTDGAFARMPYWLSLAADLAAREGRTDSARAGLDAALSGSRARDDAWWLPEVLRMRAAQDPPEQAFPRLQAAAALAAEQGSVALLDRCVADLRAIGADVAPGSGRPADGDADGAFAVRDGGPGAPARANGLRTERS